MQFIARFSDEPHIPLTAAATRLLFAVMLNAVLKPRSSQRLASD